MSTVGTLQFVKSQKRLSHGRMMDPQLHDSKVLGQTVVARPKNSNDLAPNCDLTLKTRASKHPLEEYFGTKDKMAVIM